MKMNELYKRYFVNTSVYVSMIPMSKALFILVNDPLCQRSALLTAAGLLPICALL